MDTAGLPPLLRGATHRLTVAMLSRYISFSFFALLVWDMLLTLKDEVHWPCLLRHVTEIALIPSKVQLIWPARWTVIKGMFLINRYGVPVMMTLGFASKLI
jgi:hypothetical protein